MKREIKGKKVEIEAIFFLNDHLKSDRKKKMFCRTEKVCIPRGHKKGGVPGEVYDAYRAGLDSACADIVVCTRLPSGLPAVVAIKRAQNKCFGGKWWMQGGAIQSYRSVRKFVAERAEKECGAKPRVEALIGVFHTCAQDFLGSTTNICFVGSLPFEQLKSPQADKDHSAWSLLTSRDLKKIPKKGRHWYPMLCFKTALETMP